MRKPWLKAAVFIFFLYLLQNIAALAFGWSVPVFLVVGVVFFSLQNGPLFGACLALYTGCYLELFELGRMGLSSVILVAVAAGTGAIASRIFKENLWVQTLLPALTLFFLGFRAPGDLLLSSLLAPSVFWLLKFPKPERSIGKMAEL